MASLAYQTPLEQVGPRSVSFTGPGFTLAEDSRAILQLRGDGPGLPTRPQDTAIVGGATVLWLRPGMWWFIGTQGVVDNLRRQFEGQHLHDMSHQIGVLRLAGVGAAELLTQHCALELAPGESARTLIAGVPVVMHNIDNGFDLYVDRSLTHFLWLSLTDVP